MSYCRVGDDSDVHVYRSNQSADLPFVVHLKDGPGRVVGTRDQALHHLLGLRDAGYKVPQRALDRLSEGR